MKQETFVHSTSPMFTPTEEAMKEKKPLETYKGYFYHLYSCPAFSLLFFQTLFSECPTGPARDTREEEMDLRTVQSVNMVVYIGTFL